MQRISLCKIQSNTGQIAGLPRNPRVIKDRKYRELLESVKALPEMLDYRPLLVFPNGDKFVLIGGNMRFRVLKELGYTDAPCDVLPADMPIDKVREIVKKDNQTFGDWDMGVMFDEWGSDDVDSVIDLPDEFYDEQPFDEKPHKKEAKPKGDTEPNLDLRNTMVADVLFASNNAYDIPTLDIKKQAGVLELPFAAYGADSRLRADIASYHFYVDDYRFEAIWKDPRKLLQSGCRQIVEPNLSLYDTTPIAYGLNAIYRKRWIARWLQERGILVFADLNVSSKFYTYNVMGIPQGWNAFATRGYSDRLDRLETEIAQAQRISERNVPNMIIYGGGNRAHEIAAQYGLIYVEQFINSYGKK